MFVLTSTFLLLINAVTIDVLKLNININIHARNGTTAESHDDLGPENGINTKGM